MLEGHGEAVVEGLRAHDTVFTGVHDEAAEARVGGVLRVELGQELLVVDSDGAGDVVLAFEGNNLREHLLLVLLDCLVYNRGQDSNIALSAPEGDLGLNQLDESLDEEVLQELGVLTTVVGEALGHLDTSVTLQALN